jgi:hypothetical protein
MLYSNIIAMSLQISMPLGMALRKIGLSALNGA